MDYQPTIFCSRGFFLLNRQEFCASKFWKISIEQKDQSDVQLDCINGVIHVNNLTETFELGTCLNDILNRILPYNLSYIENLFDSEFEQTEVLNLATNELKKNLKELIQAINEESSNATKLSAHKLQSKLLVLSIPSTNQCTYIESHADNFASTEFKNNFHLLKMYCLIRLWQIDTIQLLSFVD